LNDIANSKYLKKKRNKLLYHLELGRLFHLNGDYEESNKHLNYADDLMDLLTEWQNFAATAVVNDEAKKYQAEPFEKILIHYYKALNYIYLNNIEDALVEARRINLKEMELNEKGEKKYRSDPFGLLLEAQIYEKAKDYGNAFIAYRNAYESYLNEGEKIGVSIPIQLQQDLLRMAYLSNQIGELQYYEREFKTKYTHRNNEFGEVILYWENGLAPYKVEKQYVFTLIGGNGGFYFVDQDNSVNVPFAASATGGTQNDFSNLSALRVALPKYESSEMYYIPDYSRVIVNEEQTNKYFELTENLDELARKTLKERFAKDLATHLTKLAINQLAQQALASDSSTAALGMVLEGIGFVTEKADTRNWQSLPSRISYTRIPLTQEGTNNIKIEFKNYLNNTETIKIPVESRKGELIFKNIFTPGKIPYDYPFEKPQNDTITTKKQ